MSEAILHALIFQIFSILILLFFIGFLLRQTNSLRLERRFEPFSLLASSSQDVSFLDRVSYFIWKMIHKISKLLAPIPSLKKYSQKYERYITFEEKEFKSGLDYVSLKYMIGFLFVIFYLFAVLFGLSFFHVLSVLFVFAIGYFLLDIFLSFEFHKKRKQIEEDLLKAIIIMNNSFKSGRSIMQAIDSVKSELNGPIADEFKKISLDISYGLSLDVVFERFYERVKLEDAKYIASSLTLLNKTGGNIVRVFDTIERSIFDKKKLRNELTSLTSASVFVFRLLLILPFVFVLLIYFLNPSYFSPLFSSKLGLFFVFLILLLFSLYVVVIRKVLKVKM